MFTLVDVRKEYDRLDKLCGIDTSNIELQATTRSRQMRACCFHNGEYKPTAIRISSMVLAENKNSFYNTIRHEYAHALTWIRGYRGRNHHGKEWKQSCAEVGCKPERLYRSAEYEQAIINKANWVIRCTECGTETIYFRAGKIVKGVMNDNNNYKCGLCGHSLDIERRG